MSTFDILLVAIGLLVFGFLFIKSQKKTNKKHNPSWGGGSNGGNGDEPQNPEGPQTPQKFEG